MHKTVLLQNLGLSFANKLCFDDFSTQICPGSHIAIIGRNGNGKSSLLNILRGTLKPSDGEIVFLDGLSIGYVEQTISQYDDLSGGQRLNKQITEALSRSPDMLLLDEPTNHLDINNRKSLIQMLMNFNGTLIVVSHDMELLRNCTDTFWHIDYGKVYEYHGAYSDYLRDRDYRKGMIEKELLSLKRDKRNIHEQLMKEQARASKSKSRGQKNIDNRKWPTITNKAKALRAEKTSGKKKSAIDRRKQHLSKQLSNLRLPEVILPKFSLDTHYCGNGNVLSIREASIAYVNGKTILRNIFLSISAKERVVIHGENASGKSTLLKAILDNDGIIKTGDWHLPQRKNIGYLDQHYSNLKPEKSVIEHIQAVAFGWEEARIRKQLNGFLFRTNEEVYRLGEHLSGGEKARLSLCLISTATPKLLILDEITNNLDIETKEHVIQALENFPGSMILVSHEEDFINEICVDHHYHIKGDKLTTKAE